MRKKISCAKIRAGRSGIKIGGEEENSRSLQYMEVELPVYGGDTGRTIVREKECLAHLFVNIKCFFRCP